MSTITEHEAQIDLRLSREAKSRAEYAAAVSGQSVDELAVSALARAAEDILQRHHTIVLGDEDRDFFLALLEADEEPSEKEKAAAARYRQGVHKSGEYHW